MPHRDTYIVCDVPGCSSREINNRSLFDDVLRGEIRNYKKWASLDDKDVCHLHLREALSKCLEL